MKTLVLAVLTLVACGAPGTEEEVSEACLTTVAACAPCHEGNYRIAQGRYLICDAEGAWQDAGEAP